MNDAPLDGRFKDYVKRLRGCLARTTTFSQV